MPDFTITLSTAQVQRLLACGAFDEVDAQGNTIPATTESVKRRVWRYVRSEVLRAELGNVAGSAEAIRRAEMEAEGW